MDNQVFVRQASKPVTILEVGLVFLQNMMDAAVATLLIMVDVAHGLFCCWTAYLLLQCMLAMQDVCASIATQVFMLRNQLGRCVARHNSFCYHHLLQHLSRQVCPWL
jgi:hypothetical protein